ncbi:hypothetical protein YC2023_018337 [Brassica napus]
MLLRHEIAFRFYIFAVNRASPIRCRNSMSSFYSRLSPILSLHQLSKRPHLFLRKSQPGEAPFTKDYSREPPFILRLESKFLVRAFIDSTCNKTNEEKDEDRFWVEVEEHTKIALCETRNRFMQNRNLD